MTTLTGIHDAEYLAQFLGKKIAIRVGPKEPVKTTYCYWLYPELWDIFANGSVVVRDSEGRLFGYKWEECENPYILLQEDVEIVFK